MDCSLRPSRKNCRSAESTHRRYLLKREVTAPSEAIQTSTAPMSQQKGPMHMLRQKKAETIMKPDLSKEYMKLLISSNSQYFKNKIKVTDKLRPNNYRFKMPMNTGKTMYKNEYRKKQKDFSVDNLMLNSNTLPQSQTMKHFEAKTSYQKQFVKSKADNTATKKGVQNVNNTWMAEDAPMFLETTNKNVFLNWAGKNCITSMKPSPNPATSNLPFQASSVYTADFQNKAGSKNQQVTKTIVPENSISLSKFPNKLMIKESKYRSEFANKENKGREVSCKPKNVATKTTKGFKGSTQYRSQFDENLRQNGSEFGMRERTTEELQALIIDL